VGPLQYWAQVQMLRIAILGVGAFVVALVPAFIVTAWAAGALWIFVYGDSVWPDTADWVLVSTFLVSWFGAGSALTATLSRNPRVKRFTTGQLMGASVLMGSLAISVLVVHQWLIGNLGREPHPCALVCKEKGFSGASWSDEEPGIEDCTCHGVSQSDERP
jgi:hypothetical protein